MIIDPLKKIILSSIFFLISASLFYIYYLKQENNELKINLNNEKTKVELLQDKIKTKNFEQNITQEKEKLKNDIKIIDAKPNTITVQKNNVNSTANNTTNITIKTDNLKNLSDGNYTIIIK